jgi:sRNA-binding protein
LAALRVYTANKVYRSRLVAGVARIGLDGEPAGVVAENEMRGPAVAVAAAAAMNRATAAPDLGAGVSTRTTSAAPKRISLADLRAAAQRRKAVMS